MSSSSSSIEKFIFVCDQHAANICAQLKQFYNEKRYFDTVLIAGENATKVSAHKIVLSASSDYFWEIFHGNPTISNANEVKLKEIEASTLQRIIDFMYSGAIEISSDNVGALLGGAEFLKMKNLLDGCIDFLKKNLNKSTCLHSLRLAKKLRLPELRERCLNLIYNNFEEVRKQPEFLLLNEMEVKDLLFKDNPNGDFEEEVFLGLVDWTEHDEISRGNLLYELLSMVRYQFLTPKFIIKNRSSVCKTLKNCEVIYGWLQYYLWPESRTIEQQNFFLTPATERKKEKDSKIIAAIGLNERKELEMHCYDEQLNTWIIKTRTQYLPSKKYSDYSQIAIDGKLLIVGGNNSFNGYVISNRIECVDLKTFKLSELPPMGVPRGGSQLANLNGHLIVFGGYNKRYVDSLETFNFSTNKWAVLEAPFTIDSSNQKICDDNGILYILDNRYGFLYWYDISSMNWNFKRIPIDDNVQVLGVSVVGDFIYTVCRDKLSINGNVIKCFDLSKNTWSEECRFNNNNPILKVTSVIDSKIWITRSAAEVFEYNLATKEITPRSKLKYTNFSILPFKL